MKYYKIVCGTPFLGEENDFYETGSSIEDLYERGVINECLYETGNEWYDDIVVQYANKARTLSNYAPIYGYDLEVSGQGRLEGELNLKNVPALLHIKDGSVSKTYTNWSDIRNTLTDAMDK